MNFANTTMLSLAISLISLSLFLYPYLIYPLILRALPKYSAAQADHSPSFSLLFCAHNEARSLPAKIANLRELKSRCEDLEILVYDDFSSDRTPDILRDAEDILTIINADHRTGKARGMIRLAAHARGDILVFTDANVILKNDVLEKVAPYYSDDMIGGVCGTLCYNDDRASATADVGTSYWRLDEHLRTMESATGNVMGADGSIFSIRRELYPEFPDDVLDDMTVSMSVIFQGRRLIAAPDVIAFENNVSDFGDEIRRKIRIGARAARTHQHLKPQLKKMPLLDRFKYNSHKILRWWGGLFLGIACLSAFFAAAQISALIAVGLVALAILALVVLTALPESALAKPFVAIALVVAAFYGVLLGTRGKTFVIWSPAKSR